MATKKRATTKSNKRSSAKTGSSKSKGSGLIQVDDPIIVKPGGSITIEFERRFGRQANPSARRRKHRHAGASRLTQVVIQYSDGTDESFNLGSGDAVQICYEGSYCPIRAKR
jgi:hypothetical protein